MNTFTKGPLDIDHLSPELRKQVLSSEFYQAEMERVRAEKSDLVEALREARADMLSWWLLAGYSSEDFNRQELVARIDAALKKAGG